MAEVPEKNTEGGEELRRKTQQRSQSHQGVLDRNHQDDRIGLRLDAVKRTAEEE